MWLFAILLSLINHILYQILEGYRFPTSSLRFLKTRTLEDFDRLISEISRRGAEWQAKGDQYPIERQLEYDRLLEQRASSYPSEKHLLLPTRFGNVIRGFEDYSRSTYGADSIPLWNHLSSVLPEGVVDELMDARTEVNCLVNMVFLSLLIGMLAAGRAVGEYILGDVSFAARLHQADLVLIGLLAFAVSRASYLLAIERGVSWGNVVKASFDCYLPSLAVQLGFELPKSAANRREFWIEVSRQAIYHRPMNADRWVKQTPPDRDRGKRRSRQADSEE